MVKSSLFFTSSRPALWPTLPLMQWISGSLSLGAKLTGPETDQSPLTSAEVKKIWIYTSTPIHDFMA
jgi:hypothetical protein